MIKIVLDKETQKAIKSIHWEDAQTAQTGLVKRLEKDEIRDWLREEYTFLYDYFYNSMGKLEKEKVKELLFLNRVEMKKLISKWKALGKKDSEELLKRVFLYDNFSNRKVASKILRKMKVEVCPYCNRQYIHTVKSGKVRAQFDHYYPKSLYPYLALSLYNMIPSCAVCNTAKSSLDTMKTPVLYPYDEEFGHETKFVLEVQDDDYVKVWQGVSNRFSIRIKAKEGTIRGAIDNQNIKLHLEELYNEHKNFVMGIIKSKNINSPDRIHELYLHYSSIFDSENEIKGLLYMTNLEIENWGKRPLTKLIYDIDHQFDFGK